MCRDLDAGDARARILASRSAEGSHCVVLGSLQIPQKSGSHSCRISVNKHLTANHTSTQGSPSSRPLARGGALDGATGDLRPGVATRTPQALRQRLPQVCRMWGNRAAFGSLLFFQPRCWRERGPRRARSIWQGVFQSLASHDSGSAPQSRQRVGARPVKANGVQQCLAAWREPAAAVRNALD